MNNAILKLAVLDMAGTTIDVADEVPKALQEAFAHSRLDVPVEAISEMRGRSKREAIQDLVSRLTAGDPGNTGLSDQIFDAFRRRLHERYLTGVRPIAGAADTLRWLQAHNIAVILTTGFDRELANLLIEKSDWGKDLLSGLVCADDVSRGRPEPDMILRAMDILSLGNPAAVAVVGDTTADLEAGNRAGAGYVIGVLSGAHSREELGKHPHTVLLDSIADLPSWLEKRGS